MGLKLMKNDDIFKKPKRRFGDSKAIKIAAICVAVILALLLVVIFLPGRIVENEKGVRFEKFGIPTKEKWITTKGNTYYFGKDGYAYKGWKDIGDAKYFFSDKGVMKKGWLENNDNKYYFNILNGTMVKGFFAVEDQNYYFSEENGALQKGIIYKDDKIIAYSDEEGKLHTGVCEVEGALRCFSQSGESKQGWVNISQDSYYCNADGLAAVGNTEIDGKRYLFDEKGILKKGWCEDTSGNKYYAGEDGVLATGKQSIEDKTYYFDENSVMRKGWINLSDSERCYAGEDGVLLTGTQSISGIEFTFDENGVLISQSTDEIKMVALTFDDGPSVNTDKVLDVLEQYGCKATFFIVGSRVSEYSAQLKRAYDLGCEIGSHTYNHKYLTSVSDEERQSELSRTDEAVEAITGRRTTCLRPPGGFYNDDVVSKIDSPIIMWNIDTQDWKTKDPQSIAQIATTGIKDGDIILMHDLYSTTAEAVEQIVPSLISQGFQIVTVQELLDAHGGSFSGKVYYTATEFK